MRVTAEELYEHKDHINDVFEVNRYGSIKDFLMRRKIRGRIDLPDFYDDKRNFDKAKYINFLLYTSDGRIYIFNMLKEGKTINDIIDPSHKYKREQFMKNLITPNDLKLLECHPNIIVKDGKIVDLSK